MNNKSVSFIHTRRRGSATFVLKQKPYLQGTLLLFCLLVVSMECSILTLKGAPIKELGLFLLLSSMVLSFSALSISFIKRFSTGILLLSFIALAVLPAILLGELRGEQRAFLDLFFLALIAIPIWFRIWGWRAQTTISVITTGAMAVLNFQEGGDTSYTSMLLVFIAAVLSVIVSVIRPQEKELFDLGRIESNYFERVQTTHFEKQVWKSSLLQGVFILLLIFVDISILPDVNVVQVVPKIYALIVVVLGMLLLRIVRRSFRGWIMLLSTVVVSLFLASGRTQTPALIVSAVPLMYLAFSTAGLPWFFGKQIALSWALSMVAIYSRLFSRVETQGEFLDTFISTLIQYHSEIQLTVFGAALSVAISKVLETRLIKNLSLFREDVTFDLALKDRLGVEESVVIRKERFSSSAQSGIGELRARNMLKSLAVCGVLLSFVATILLMKMNPSYWSIAGIGWLIFLTTFGSVVYLSLREESRERARLIGGLLSLSLFLFPASLLVFANDGKDYWVLLPISILVGFGSAPWVLAEIIPIVGASLVGGIEILSRLGLEYRAITLFGFSAILSITFSTQLYRRLKEIYLLTNFHNSIRQTNTIEEASRVLADYVRCLFDVDSAIVSTERSKLELLRGKTLYALKSHAWPIAEIGQVVTQIEVSSNGVGMSIVHWLPAQYGFFDFSFGEFSPRHGILLELCSPLRGEESRPDIVTEEDKDKQKVLIFIPTPLPTISFFKKEALVLVNTLASITTLHLRAFFEQDKREEERQHGEQVQVEREYELSTLVHDINNTVQDLTLLCDGILEDVEGDRSDKKSSSEEALIGRVGRIATMARSMATVVSDAKRKRELEKTTDLSPREYVEVMGVLNDILQFARIRGERRRIKIEFRGVDEETPVWVRVSAREHLETILRNLLNNAVMYTDPGTTIEIGVRYDEHSVWIECKDNGPGLSAEECQAIFLSGVRGSIGRKRSGGLGLGLSQSRRVAESAGGSLEVQSPGAGFGSTFIVMLPRHLAPVVKQLSKESWALIVEDQPSLSDFYARIMKALHVIPALASSTNEAAEILEKRGRPTFVLTDLHLGGTDGLDLVKALRKQFDAKLPILVVSGMSDDNVEERVREAGATDFLAKPVGKRILFARIQSLLPIG